MSQRTNNANREQGEDPTLDTSVGLKQHHISVPYYRIVCPAVYGGEWANESERVGPGTFWTPRPDDIESMIRAIFTHAPEYSSGALASEQWRIQIFEIREGIVEEVENFNPYGREIHFGERKLVAALSPPKCLLDVHLRDLKDSYARIELLLELPTTLGAEIKKFIDFSKGFQLVMPDGAQAFALADQKIKCFRIGVPEVTGFREIARLDSPEKFWRFIDERGVTFANRDDEFGVDLYFRDFAEREEEGPKKQNPVFRRRRATRTPFRT